MNKTWIFYDRLSDKYYDKVDDFLEVDILGSENRMSIRCPYTPCCNMELLTPKK